MEKLNEFLNREDDEGITAYFEENEISNEMLLHEEVYWKQGQKFWLKEGDTNSRFFHAQESKRKKLNNSRYLITDDGEKVDIGDQMSNLTKEYFEGVFTADENVTAPTANSESSVITETQNLMLKAEVSFEKFTLALKQMHLDKASGPNGYSPAIFSTLLELGWKGGF